MYKDITSKKQLQERIERLQQEQAREWPHLKTEANLLFESMKPVNIVKDMLLELTKVPEIKHNILNSAIGMGAGYVSKRVLFGAHPSKVLNILGSFMEMSVSGLVAKNTEGLSGVIIDKVGQWFRKSPADTK